MRKLLYLLPSLDYGGHARQASLLAVGMPRDRFAVEVISLDGKGPFAGPMEAAGIRVTGLKRRPLWNLDGWLALRQYLRQNRPDLVHVFGLAALRQLGWACLGDATLWPPTVVSSSLSGFRQELMGVWSRRLLRRASAIVVPHDGDRGEAIAQGIPAEKVQTIRPGVPIPTQVPERTTVAETLGLPSEGRWILSVGAMKTRERMRITHWGFDILHYVETSIDAAIIGGGPFRESTVAIAEASMFDDLRIRFPGALPNAAQLLPLAELIWAMPPRSGGTYAVLEGMAAGRPVIASALPHLAAILRDGETGRLVPPRDTQGLAQVSRLLLNDPAARQRLGNAARQSIHESFHVDAMIERFASLYDRTIP